MNVQAQEGLITQLRQIAAANDGLRQQVSAKANRYRKAALPAAGIALVIFTIAFASIGAGICAGMAALLGLVAFAQYLEKPAGEIIKDKVNAEIARAFDLQFHAAAQESEAAGLAKKFALLPQKFSRQTYEDMWIGKVGDCPLYFHQASYSRQGHETRITLFNGIILRIEMPTPFTGTTIIDDADRRSFMGMSKSATKLGGLTLERAEPVDPRHAERFGFWTTSVAEARFAIPAAMLDGLMQAAEEFSCQQIRALFHDNSIVVTIETDDVFESGSVDPRDDHERAAHSLAEVQAIMTLAARLTKR